LARKNEFLRQRPAQKNRNVLYDITNFIIPLIFVCIGIVLFAQTFSKLVDYNPNYTGEPLFILTADFLHLEKGYRFFNPGMVFLNIASKPFDPVIEKVLFPSFIPLGINVAAAVFFFFIVSAIRGYQMNRSDKFYGSARWGTEKDLKKFGLMQENGIVLAQTQSAVVDFIQNPKTQAISLTSKKEAPLICHGGGTHTLTIAPPRSGKGVSSVVPTCLNYKNSMIIFDPKGELFLQTAGFRKQFSTILKFSPISKDTVCFNPLEEVELTEQAFADIGLILTNMFEEPKKGSDGASQFFENNAQDLLTGIIFHVLSSKIYGHEMKNLNGVLTILSQAGGDDNEENGMGEQLLNEMINSKHYDKDGNESDYIHKIIKNSAERSLKQHFKVRSDVFSTIFSKMRLFEDPYISYVTGHSDFKLQDFYETKYPITLYLTVPFSDIDRIAPVFKLLINFILNKFSRGEASYGEVKLPYRIMFLIDEFPVLGSFPFLSKTMGILPGYGINFYIVVQGLNQIIDIYGQNHTFLDNCKTVMVFAPGKIEDAKAFTEMIGKESVIKESISASGSRYGVSLNNLNASSQEIARDLMNPDELIKLPPNEALILNQGMPAYIAKKVVYYNDSRFKDKAYSKSAGKTTGFPPPATRKELEKEIANLPSYQKAKESAKTATAPSAQASAESEREAFNPLEFIAGYQDEEESPQGILSIADIEMEEPPVIMEFSPFNVDTEES